MSAVGTFHSRCYVETGCEALSLGFLMVFVSTASVLCRSSPLHKKNPKNTAERIRPRTSKTS